MHLLPTIPALEEHIQPIQRHQGSPGASTSAPRPGPTRRARAGGAKVELWRISAEGGAPQRVGLAMDRLSHLRLHPDGRRIVFDALDARPENNEVWVMEHFLPELSATQ